MNIFRDYIKTTHPILTFQQTDFKIRVSYVGGFYKIRWKHTLGEEIVDKGIRDHFSLDQALQFLHLTLTFFRGVSWTLITPKDKVILEVHPETELRGLLILIKQVTCIPD